MKTTILLLFAALFSLSNCTEEIIIDKIFRDTVYIDKPKSFAPTFVTVTDTIHSVDTVEVKVIIHDVDTLVQYVTKDSLIIQTVEKIVEHRDTVVIHDVDTVVITLHDTVTVTVYDRTVVYLDTLRQPLYWKSIHFIPQELEAYVREFYSQAPLRGWTNVIGGALVIQYVREVAGENWSSFSYWIGEAQMVIEISEQVPGELARSCVLRELARLQLKKKYVTDINKIMCPLWPIDREIKPIDLDILFSPLSI